MILTFSGFVKKRGEGRKSQPPPCLVVDQILGNNKSPGELLSTEQLELVGRSGVANFAALEFDDFRECWS